MKLFSNLSNIGVRESDDYFDSRLKRAVNILSMNALICILLSALFKFFVQSKPEGLYILFSFPFYFFVIYLNSINKSLLAVTFLFMTSSLLLTIYSIRNGENTFTHCHYVNNIYGVSLLYNKDKAKNYFYFNMIFTLLSVVFVFLCYRYNWFDSLRITVENPTLERQINFIILIFCSFLFSLVIVNSYLYQRRELQASLAEQKTLLAELNHRVKNNLAIIVSLLNLKHDKSKNEETKDALMECRNRVMSMALVHQKMYQSDSKNYVVMQSYIKDLVTEIKNSLEIKKEVVIHTYVDSIKLNLTTAIPLGLILNELITNSFKHAFVDIPEPEININLMNAEQGFLKLTVKDNGKGSHSIQNKKPESLGLALITSLCEQIDAECNFTFDKGLEFSVIFPVT